MVASSIAFSSFLSLLPLLALVALAYGTFTEPQEVIADLRALTRVIPVEARGLITSSSSEALLSREGRGTGFALSIALTVFSASRAGRSLLYGLNVACRVDRRPSFVARRVIAVLIVLAAAALVTAVLVAVSAFAFVVRFLPELPFASELAQVLFWIATAAVTAAMLTAIYRHGPARAAPPWRDVAPGAVLATVLWLGATALFSIYLGRFGDFGRVYGSLGAVIVLQLWLLGSASAFLLGARFNVELASDEATVAG
ncbi:membrane protein [Sphingomonas rubra]|uniref:Membrane protein n=2 Tax=Sphingomonas rubra TaxID=634430 RepID=A0A1I5Q1T4_9SPHN|nr:membrane protein [Sphingomonas rubra]